MVVVSKSITADNVTVVFYGIYCRQFYGIVRFNGLDL